MMVRLCMCECTSVCVCVRVRVGVDQVSGSVSRRRVDKVTENEGETVLSLLLFLSLSFSPFWRTGFESECIIKTNWLFLWHLRRRATCRLLRNQTEKNNLDQRFLSEHSLQILPELTRFWNPFYLHLSEWNYGFIISNSYGLCFLLVLMLLACS